MRKPVMVGFDGSAAGEAAVRHGAQEAVERGTDLCLVHAFGWFPLLPPSYPPYNASAEGPRQAVLDVLAETALGVQEQCPDLRVTTRMVDGSPSRVLVDASGEAGLVVVGHRGTGGFAGLLAGSTAMQLVGHAACPVTVVRGTDRPRDAVVLGLDGSARALAAAEVAAGYARRRRAELVVVHRTRGPSREHDDLVTAQAAQLGRRLGDVRYRLERTDGSSAAADLIDTAVKFRAGMIVVGSRGRGGFRGLITGSTARALVEHAGCPVTVVPSPAGHDGPRDPAGPS